MLGQTIDLSGTTYTVIGVAPAWFRFPTAEFQLWAPLSSIDIKAPAQAKNRAFRIFSAVARLKPGVTLQQAQAEAQAFSTRLAREFPATNEGVTLRLQPLYDRLVGDARPGLRILLGTVGTAAAHRLCQRRQPDAGADDGARARDGDSRRARRRARRGSSGNCSPKASTLAVAGGLLGLLVTMWGIDLLPAVLEARAARRRHPRRRRGPRVLGVRDARHRHVLRPRAGAADDRCARRDR